MRMANGEWRMGENPETGGRRRRGRGLKDEKTKRRKEEELRGLRPETGGQMAERALKDEKTKYWRTSDDGDQMSDE